MAVDHYRMLITVHLRDASYRKGQVVTLSEMGANAFVLLHFGLALRIAEAGVRIAA